MVYIGVPLQVHRFFIAYEDYTACRIPSGCWLWTRCRAGSLACPVVVHNLKVGLRYHRLERSRAEYNISFPLTAPPNII